jgi:hypothetical protein
MTWRFSSQQVDVWVTRDRLIYSLLRGLFKLLVLALAGVHLYGEDHEREGKGGTDIVGTV